MKAHVIELTYKKKDQVSSAQVSASDHLKTQSGGEQFEAQAKRTSASRDEGDTLKWKSDDDYITVELRPKCMFSSNLFSTDPVFCKKHKIKPVGRPVKIKELGPFQYWCGFRDKKSGEIIGYPGSKDIGVEDPGH
jgi:hypothetical protein